MFNICSVPGCNRPHVARGYCRNHYVMARQQGTLMPIRGRCFGKNCSVPGCNNPCISKDLCHTHYELRRRNGTATYKYHKCAVSSCNQSTCNKYCHHHNTKFEKGIPFDAPKGWHVRGERNWNWKGGVADYPNHYEFKQQRKIKLESVDYICERCDSPAKHIHHKDGTRWNHVLDNLEALCTKCHAQIHHPKILKEKIRLGTKFTRLYGMTLSQAAQLLNRSISYVYYHHQDGTLASKLETQLTA